MCATAWLVALVLSGCVYPATELRVVVGTDVDPTVPMTLTVRAFRGAQGGRMITQHTFRRAAPGETGADAGFTFPASFAVVPGDQPRDGVTRIEVEADADGVLLRRVVVANFATHRTGVLRLFLAARCGDPALGCVTGPCTVRQKCEELGQTCGNAGVCVPIELTPSTDLDGGFGDVADPPTCGHPGMGCCSIGAPCSDGFECIASVCTACPVGSEACCDHGSARANGAVCTATADACRVPGTCTDGVCSGLTDAPDGTECAAATGPCGLPSTCVAGACTARTAPEGTECAPPADACSLPSTCVSGACTAQRAPDGTVCGLATGLCGAPATCAAGVCTPRSLPDGTVCAMASGGCVRDGVCSAGACTGTTPLPDGTVCAMAGNACQRNGTCSAGVCSGTTAAPDGTVCATSTGPCMLNSTCTAGVCVANNVANGTVCATTTNPCQRNGTCNNGVCGAIANLANGTVCVVRNTAACDAARTCLTGVCQPAAALPNGTVCRAAANACQLAATCTSGTCPTNPRRADNYVISSTQRCCGGVPTSVTTATNCGVCGLRCSASCVARSVNGTHYFCTCTSNGQCAPLSTCRTSTPNANICACTSDTQCPGSAVCVNVSFNPNYCN